jgi:hypothetical protein
MADTVEALQKQVAVLEQKLASIEIDGKAKLYYSLNRNMSDLSDMLDGIELKNIDLEDPKSKGMERLKMIWASVKPLVETISLLGLSAGITGNEADDTARKPFVETIADKRT